MSVPWFIVQTKTKSELTARDNLLNQGFIVYLPLCARDRRHKSDGFEPLFPNYLFLQAISDVDYHPVRNTVGCLRLVSFGDNPPAQLPAGVVEELMAGEESHRIARNYRRGDSVVFHSGIFVFREAVYQEPDGEQRAWLLLDLLGQSRRVQADLSEFAPV